MPAMSTVASPRRLFPFAALALATLWGAAGLPGATDATAAQPRVGARPTFAAGSLEREWTLDGNGAWDLRDGILSLVTAGKPGGPIRRPSALAIAHGPDLTDTTLEVDLRSTAALPPVTPRRDALLVVGYQSPTRFYYVHLSSVRDDVHNGIFLVDGADRRRIDSRSDVAPLVDQAWHHARLVRTTRTGAIEVYIDRGTSPIMVATDTTLQWGRTGVGSFDDTAEFRELVATGRPKQDR